MRLWPAKHRRTPWTPWTPWTRERHSWVNVGPVIWRFPAKKGLPPKSSISRWDYPWNKPTIFVGIPHWWNPPVIGKIGFDPTPRLHSRLAISGFPSCWKMGVSSNEATQKKWMVYMGNPTQNGWFGVPLWIGNLQIALNLHWSPPFVKSKRLPFGARCTVNLLVDLKPFKASCKIQICGNLGFRMVYKASIFVVQLRVKISVDYFRKWGSSRVEKCSKPCKAIGPPKKSENLWPYVGKIDEENSTFSAHVPCSCHIICCSRRLSHCILQAVCFFFPGPKAGGL